MLKTKEVEKTIISEEVISCICDKCKKEFFVDDIANTFEFQEFLNISFTGGYGSVFGDGVEIDDIHICQYCLYEFLKDSLPTTIKMDIKYDC